ncbi:MAG: aspartate kinase [bacterium]
MNVEVFKFGGASVNSAEGVRNVARILNHYPGRSMMLILSAIGKTTNAIEEILHHYMAKDAASMVERFYKVRDFHQGILEELFADRSHPVFPEVEQLFESLREVLRTGPAGSYDETYDRVVCFGELVSTAILHHFLSLEGIPNTLFPATGLIRTDSTFRDARIDWRKTQLAIQRYLFPFFLGGKGNIGLTQGFLGCDPEGRTTTLGREGSDFSAAIIGYCMRVKSITIWKDVPGVLNADPKWFEHPEKIDTLSFHEAVELAYYGATVIHPKTIKPLENANITLYVKSFLNPEAEGTLVRAMDEWKISIPVFIRKENQLLISISPRDFSFIVEENLSQIFTILANLHVKANVMQLSAISFSVCADHDPVKIKPLLLELKKAFEVRYNEGLTLYTIRHYNDDAIRRIISGREVLLEQKTRNTVHLVVK